MNSTKFTANPYPTDKRTLALYAANQAEPVALMIWIVNEASTPPTPTAEARHGFGSLAKAKAWAAENGFAWFTCFVPLK